MTATLLLVIVSLQAQAPAPSGTPDLRAFTDYVEREWPGERALQDINCRALDLMVSAAEAVAAKRNLKTAEVMQSATSFRERRQAYCSGTPADREQPRKLRRALVEGSSVIEKLAESSPHGKFTAHVNALDRAAQSLDDDAPLRRQPDVIERFFHHAAELLTLVDR